MYYVYILYSEKLNSYYKGHSSSLRDRLNRHNSGKEKYTKKGTPWLLLWSTQKTTKSEAYKLEMKLKNLSVNRTKEFMLRYNMDLTDEGITHLNSTSSSPDD